MNSITPIALTCLTLRVKEALTVLTCLTLLANIKTSAPAKVSILQTVACSTVLTRVVGTVVVT